jgi:alanine racemase
VKSWVEVSERRLTENYKLLSEAAGDTAVLAVVKANAYGHGAAVCAPVLVRAGAEWLGVTDVAEGAAVRAALEAAGIARREQPGILVMSGLLREDAEEVVRLGLVPVVWLREQMEWLAEAAGRLGMGPVAVHVEIDTGMTRQGVPVWVELEELVEWLRGEPGIRVDGVMTHFASSEVAGSLQTATQRGRFTRAIQIFAGMGFRPGWVHAGNSSTIDNEGRRNVAWLRRVAGIVGARSMVRAGIALYGYCLPIEGEGLSEVRQGLQPVMTWKTRVIGLREVEAGETVGYNGIYCVPQAMRLALLPVGYADGLRRELSASNARAGGWAMVRGQRAPIVGRVSMNLTIVDVSEIEGVVMGDEVVVLGDGVTAEDHARLAGTIAYEIVCGVQTAHRCGIAG